MNDILKKIIYEFNKYLFFKSLIKLKKTPPITYDFDESVVVVTMVGHSTVLMYLLAIKTFLKNFRYGCVEVINDGSLTKQDRELIKKHVPEIRFSEADDVKTLSCPTYISWKRLFRIAELAKQSYVIQLDSDTVSLAPLVDIHDKVKANEGFVIGSERWGKPVDVSFLSRLVKSWNNNHVQARAEENFESIDFFKDGTRYLRACAGFAGYPKNFATTDQIEELSRQIEEKIGKKWHEWGSEQTATLCLISKTPNASILPWPKYQNYMFPETSEPVTSSSLVHFLGTNRFTTNKYGLLLNKFLGTYGS